jgi:outer membrane lipoprotein carrier protein
VKHDSERVFDIEAGATGRRTAMNAPLPGGRQGLGASAIDLHPAHASTLLAAIAVLLLSSVAQAAGSIEKLKAFAAQTQSARATFTQTVQGKDGATVQTASGKLVFARPGKFRWEYEKPYQQTIVGDGQKLWVYDKDLNQVTVKKIEGALGSSPAALLAGSNDIEQYYNLDAKGSKGGLDWLEAYPRDEESMFSKVRMGFKGNMLDTMELYDHMGQVTLIRFAKLQRNPKLGDDLFTFTPPTGADVIEDQ